MNTEYAKELPPGWQSFSRIFAALGDDTRQKILLLFESGEEICVGEIASLFNLSRPAISHHLKVLRTADLLESEKRGKEVYYRVNRDHFAKTLSIVYNYFAPEVPANKRQAV